MEEIREILFGFNFFYLIIEIHTYPIYKCHEHK